MRVKIGNFYYDYYKWSEEYRKIVSDIKQANLPIIERQSIYEDYVEIYTEISTLEDLDRLVEALGYKIVLGGKLYDGTMTIEKYEDCREKEIQ